ncbi:hypothetical protein [Aliihoeflea aestuarii]|nr:hypothetical protein [Aliihoeflea aestuarii]
MADASDAETLETQGVEESGLAESAEYFPISFIFEPEDPTS